MAPYTPDLLRRPMVQCPASSSISVSTRTETVPNSVPVLGINYHRPSENSKHEIFTNNNHPAMMIYQKRILDSTQPSSSSTSELNDYKKVKCVLIGDAAIGKTSLIVSYTTNGYPQEYVPTAFDNYSVEIRVDNHPIKLQLCDTAGQVEFDTLRPLCYPNTDIFLVCFSVVNPASFESVKSRWIPEIRHHSPNTPFILVGTESDLRTNIKVLVDLHRHQLTPITEIHARRFAQDIGASMYLECSSLTQQNLKETFDAAILIGIDGLGLNSNPPRSVSGLPGRKSLRKLKEKFTASRASSIDSMKHPNLRVKSGDMLSELPPRPTERMSTHSSASHMNIRGKNQKKKLSTASVPTIGGDLNAVVMQADGGNGSDRFYEKSIPSPVMTVGAKQSTTHEKSKKGWRKLLCVA